MNVTHCDTRIEAISAWVLGDLSVPEAADLTAHLDECAACQAYDAALRETTDAIRTDVPAASESRRLRVVAAARLAAAPAAPTAPPTPVSPAGWFGAIGAAAAAAILIGLTMPRSDGPASPTTAPRIAFGADGPKPIPLGPGRYRKIDPNTRLVATITMALNARQPSMPSGDLSTLQVGTLDLYFPDDYVGPVGPLAVETPGGIVTVQARPGAKYTLSQAPGASILKPGLAAGADAALRGDTGRVTLMAALTDLADQAGWTLEFAPGAGADRTHTRLAVNGASANTCLAALIADARIAGIGITRHQGTIRVERVGPSQATAPLDAEPRREGDLFVEVRGTGEAVVEAFDSEGRPGERFHARGGATVMVAGRTSGQWKLPTPGDRAALVSRITVRGTAGANVALLAVHGRDEVVAVAAGDDVLGYRVHHVGADAITLTKGDTLVRVALRGKN